jgi:hypothetical protein
MLTALCARRKKLQELLKEDNLTSQRKFQLQGAIHELEFVCMMLEQKTGPDKGHQ